MVGKVGFEPTSPEEAVLQTAEPTNCSTYPYLASASGVEPDFYP